MQLSIDGGFSNGELCNYLEVTSADMRGSSKNEKMQRLRHYEYSISILVSGGLLNKHSNPYWTITDVGLKELYELEHPWKSHFQRNAFSYATVAASISTTIAVIVGIVLN